MRRLTPNILSLALAVVGCASSPAAAQRQRPQDGPAPSAVATQPAAQRPLIIIERDPEDGATTVKLEPWAVEQDRATRSQLLLAAHTRRGADAKAGPEYVNLTLLSRSPRCRFPARTDVQLVLDGAPVALKFQPDSSTTAMTATMEVVTVFVPKTEGVLWVQSGAEEGGECAESLALTLAPQTFARLTAARAATLKVGTASFTLKPDALAALRDLGGKMKQ